MLYFGEERLLNRTRDWYCYTPKLVCEHVAVTVLRNQGVYRDREFMTNTSALISLCTSTVRWIRERGNRKGKNKCSNKLQAKM